MGRRKTPEVPPWSPPGWLTDVESDPDRDLDGRGTEAAHVIPGIGSYALSELSVRPVTGSRAVKRYVCPICNQTIPVGTPHTVVVPNDSPDHRRHFHTACWRTRSTRKPGRS